MEDKGKYHFWISIIKSILRILSLIAYAICGEVMFFIVGFIIAEFIGILEELVDKRI